jgi:hypothetical protein
MLAGAAHADEGGFELVRAAAPPIRAGRPAALSLSIVPASGYRLLADGPVLVRLSATGMRLGRALYRREDAVDPRAEVPRFELAVTAEGAGPARLRAALTFYLCRAARCRPVETATEWQLDVLP